MGFIRWIIGFVIAVISAAFAVFNLQNVDVTLNPFDDPYQLPLYLIALGFMAAGFMLGALVVWINRDPLHFKARSQKKTIKNLEKELEGVHAEADRALPSEFFPALPGRKNT